MAEAFLGILDSGQVSQIDAAVMSLLAEAGIEASASPLAVTETGYPRYARTRAIRRPRPAAQLRALSFGRPGPAP